MLPPIDKIKGVPPGAILERELRLLKMKKKQFAITIDELPQLISYICKGTRAITPKLSLKLDNYFGVDDGYFYTLQAYCDIKLAKEALLASQSKPNAEIINKSLFWDVNPDTLDFNKQKRLVIERVFDRGTGVQIDEIIRFYGKDDVIRIIQSAHSLLYTALNNAEKYLGINKNTISCYQNSIPRQPHQPYFTSSVK